MRTLQTTLSQAPGTKSSNPLLKTISVAVVILGNGIIFANIQKVKKFAVSAFQSEKAVYKNDILNHHPHRQYEVIILTMLRYIEAL